MAKAKEEVSVLTVIEKWLEITVDRFHEALDEFEIGQLDGNLWRSIMGEIIQSGDTPERVIVRFAQYGRFVDMGVGRGVPIGKRGTDSFDRYRNYKGTGMLRKYMRKPKPWYSKTKTREVFRFREILADTMADFSINEVTTALSQGITLNAA